MPVVSHQSQQKIIPSVAPVNALMKMAAQWEPCTYPQGIPGRSILIHSQRVLAGEEIDKELHSDPGSHAEQTLGIIEHGMDPEATKGF